MILPGLLSPCPICGDEPEFCPWQNGSRTVPSRSGVVRRYRGGNKIGGTVGSEAVSGGAENGGESGEKGGDDAR